MKRSFVLILIGVSVAVCSGCQRQGEANAASSSTEPATSASSKAAPVESARSKRLSGDVARLLGKAEFELTVAAAETELALLKGQRSDAQTEKLSEKAGKAASLLASLPDYDDGVKAAVSNALYHYSLEKGDGESQARVAQAGANASVRLQLIQISQNQRIVELLEKLTARDAGR